MPFSKVKVYRRVFRFEKKEIQVGFEVVQRGFLSVRKRKVIPYRGAEDEKDTETNSGKSDTRNLEHDSITSRTESMGGCVKLKTVTDIRRSSARDTLIEEVNPNVH